MKTKVGSLSVIICFIIVVFFCILACDNGSVSDSSPVAKSNSLVKVSLTVDGGTTEIQKSISVNDTDLASLTYQYNAVPQWQDPEGNNIHGTADWTTINYSDGMSLGYFSPGQWVFGIRILNNQNVIYEGFSEVKDISNSSVPVTVTVNKLVKTAAIGSVRIAVTAPAEQGDTLSISYSGSGEPFIVTATSDSAKYLFEHTVSGLNPGTYTFILTLNHPVESAEGNIVESVEGYIDVRFAVGEMAVISGHIDNGIWQIEYITVKVNSLTVKIYNWGDEENPWASAQYPVYYGNVFPNVEYAATGDRVSLSVEPDEDSELDPLDPLNPLEITYRNEDSDIPVDYTKNGNNMYTFFAPDGDVTVKAKFKSAVDIDPDKFVIRVHSLYMANKYNIQYFGRSDNPPSPGLPSERIKSIKSVKIWYDESAHKICWYSGVNDNTVKFSAGSLAGLFKGGDSYISISLKYLNTSAINNMSRMFDSCLILQSVDLSNIDTNNVTDMSYMFYKAGYNDIPDTKSQGNKKQLIKKPNTNYLEIIGMGGFDTGKVKNMAYMFSGCSAQNLDVHSFDASRVTNFSHMFAGVTDPPSYSFYRPTKFISLALENWDVGKNVLENERIDMSNMFDICNMIEEISFTNNPVPEQETKAWKFDKVINMKEMFNRCESANKIIFPKHTDLTNVTSLCEIFNRDQEIPLTGSGSFTDIFSRWDISGNDYPSSGGGIEFTENPHDRDSKGESANRLMQDTDALTYLTSEEFNTYTPNIKVEIGSTDGNLAVGKQRLKKKIVNQ